MTITEDQRKVLMESLKNSISVRTAEQAAAKAARLKKETEMKEDKSRLEAGITTVTRLQESQRAKERKIQKEGTPNLGRSAEDIVIGKRTVFDPEIGKIK